MFKHRSRSSVARRTPPARTRSRPRGSPAGAARGRPRWQSPTRDAAGAGEVGEAASGRASSSIQTDDQTLEELYAAVTLATADRRIQRCRTRSNCSVEGRRDLQPLLHPLLALLPLPGQPAHRPLRPQQPRPGQRPAQRRLDRLPGRAAYSHNLADLAAGRRLPHDPHRQDPQRLRRRALRARAPKCRPAGAPGTRSSTRTPTTTTTATLMNNNGGGRRAVRQFRQLGNARIRRNRRRRLPLRAAQRQTLLLRDRQVQPAGDRRTGGEPRRNSPSTCRSTTPRRTVTSANPRGRSRRPATTDCSPGRRSRRPRRRLQRGQRQRQAALHPRSAATSSLSEIHTYRVYYQKMLESLRSRSTKASKRSSTARRRPPAAQHLHPLHLRQRLLLRPAPPGRRQVPRLRALDPPALPHPRAGDQTGHDERRAGRQRRHRADHPRTGRSAKAGQEHRRRSLVPFLPEPRTPHPRRPFLFESFVADQRRRRERRGRRARRPEPLREERGATNRARSNRGPRGGSASVAASILAPPKNY